MPEPSDRELFQQYMLTELQMSSDYSRFLSNQGQQLRMFYLTIVSVLTGALAAMAGSQPPFDWILIGAVVATVIAILGTFVSIANLRMSQAADRERVLRAGLHRHFRALDIASFQRFGGDLMLSRHTMPPVDARAWSLSSLVGVFSIGHIFLLAVGLIGSTMRASTLFAPPSKRPILMVLTGGAALIVWMGIVTWLVRFTRRTQAEVFAYCDQLESVQRDGVTADT
jgi:hypothetical protein